MCTCLFFYHKLVCFGIGLCDGMFSKIEWISFCTCKSTKWAGVQIWDPGGVKWVGIRHLSNYLDYVIDHLSRMPFIFLALDYIWWDWKPLSFIFGSTHIDWRLCLTQSWLLGTQSWVAPDLKELTAWQGEQYVRPSGWKGKSCDSRTSGLWHAEKWMVH